MANTALENILAQKLIEIMSQEQKDKIVAEYIQNNVFGLNFDSMVREPARRKLSDVINQEINVQLESHKKAIQQLVSDTFQEIGSDPSIIKAWIKERFIRETAKKIYLKE